MLEKSIQLYQSKQVKQASHLSDSAYWDVYDNILEIKYRSYVTPRYIFNVENKFHQLSASITQPITTKKIALSQKKANLLCIEVNKEAKFLQKNS